MSDLLDQVDEKEDGKKDTDLNDFNVVEGSEQPITEIIVDSNQNSLAFINPHDLSQQTDRALLNKL